MGTSLSGRYSHRNDLNRSWYWISLLALEKERKVENRYGLLGLLGSTVGVFHVGRFYGHCFRTKHSAIWLLWIPRWVRNSFCATLRAIVQTYARHIPLGRCAITHADLGRICLYRIGRDMYPHFRCGSTAQAQGCCSTVFHFTIDRRIHTPAFFLVLSSFSLWTSLQLGLKQPWLHQAVSRGGKICLAFLFCDLHFRFLLSPSSNLPE